MEGAADGSSLAASRMKRQRHDRKGRLAALERLKQLKGGKNKYEMVEETPVYEEVDETAYSSLVQKRQDDDWIVDDDGCGYVEDGREIFDDDIEDEQDRKKARKSTETLKPPPGTKRQASGKTKDIKSMFMLLPTKKKPEVNVKLDDDDLLGDIMQEVHSRTAIKPVMPKQTVLKKREKSIPISAVPNPMGYTSDIPKAKVISPLNGSFSNKTCCTKEVENSSKVTSPAKDVSHTKMEDHLDSLDDNIFLEEEKYHVALANKEANGVNQGEYHLKETDFIKSEEYHLAPPVKEITFIEQEYHLPPPAEINALREVEVSTSQLPLVSNANGEKILKFFWLDAFEDYFKHPGIVYLFGKVWIEDAKCFVSCCIIVKGIERRIFLLPREKHFNKTTGEETEKEVIMKDVYEEFSNDVSEKYKISEFKSKVTFKKYAFDKLDVPCESEYLEVRYSAQFPPLPGDVNGSTFSHVFGTNTSSLEQLILDCKLKGPCWLEIKNLVVSTPPVSWCKLEASVSSIEDIMVAKEQETLPPLVVLSLSLQIVVNQKTQQNEIVAASCLLHTEFRLDKPAPNPPFQTHFCVLTKPSNCVFPFDLNAQLLCYRNTKVQLLDTERSLLGCLLAKIGKIDPDIIVGHDIYGYDLDILLHRITVTKTLHWSRIGRLRRGGMPHQTIGHKVKQLEKNVVCGRLLCDVKISSKELIRSKSYDLTELVKQVLHGNRMELQQEEVINMYRSSEQLLRMVDCTMADNDFTLRIMCEINVLPLALQITNIAGNLMSRTLLGGRSERNEFLLLHAFNEKNYICPDKSYSKRNTKDNVAIDDEEINGYQHKSSRKKPAYTGGLVLEPKKGFYDKYILLMDFNSLYPSIIQEYNICFTTIERLPEDANCEEIKLQEADVEPGILPTEIRKLVESRRQVKQLMKSDLSPEQYLQYEIRQKALKLTANSMYGCLGFTNSRFYAKPLAALITGKGREILLQTKDLVERMNLEVIYGDTDSLMINTNSLDYEQVMKIGNKVKAEVNKYYHHLEIDIDGVFKSMLLLKKKKYAALNVTVLPNGELSVSKELKGLDIIRRDWSELAKKVGNVVVEEILSDKPCEEIVQGIHTHLMQLAEAIKEGHLPLSEFTITKQLTKNPEDYPDKKNLPHVQVALRVNSRGGRRLKQGDTVSYVVCKDGSTLSAIQRAYHPDEVKANDNLKIDNHYYLAHQVHPVVSRLCNPIEGTDAATIAEFLGLDPSGYRQNVQQNDDDALLGAPNNMFDEDSFKNCDKLVLICPNKECGKEFTVETDFVLKAVKREYDLPMCPSTCGISLVAFTAVLCNQLNKIMRKYIQKYYQKWLICEDPACDYHTRKLPLRFTRHGPLCPACEKSSLYREYTDSQLYNQLCYIQRLFDIDQARHSLSEKEKEYSRHMNKECVNFYYTLKNEVEKVLKKSAYDIVDLNKLFADLYSS